VDIIHEFLSAKRLPVLFCTLQDVKKHQIYFVMVHDLRNISCCNYKYNLSEIHCLCDYSVVYEAQKVMITFSSNFLNFPCNSNMI